MTKPNFVCGAHNVTTEHPADMSRELLISENIQQTLNGTLVGDTLSRKYKYNLVWKALTKSEYDDLMELVDYHIDNRVPVTFIYPKWSSTSLGVDCLLRYSKSEPIGSGSTSYRIEISIELTEISSS